MAKGIDIKVDIISDPNGSAKVKREVDKLEKEVIASNKRVQANKQATSRAIIQSEEAITRSSTAQAKVRANAFIAELNRTKTAAKSAGNEIQKSLDNAFKNVTVAGAVGGLAGGLVASFTAGLSQLPSIFKAQLDEMVRIASERQNAFKGLNSLSGFLGIDPKQSQDAVRNLRLVRGGVVELADATTGLRNLLASGFSLQESVQLLEAFSDTAAFGKSAALDFGEAIKGATEGIRNGNSVLVDNVGLTKNLSAILKDAGFAEKDLSRVKEDLNVRQALFNGLLKEALPQMGDADKLTKGWTGSTAALTTAKNNLYAAIGDVIINNKQLIALVNTLTQDINSQTKAVENAETGWKKSINSMTDSFAQFVLNVRTGIAKEIADLKELINYIELTGARLGKLAMAFDVFDVTGIKGKYDAIIAEKSALVGTFSAAASSSARAYQDNYNRNVVTQMGLPLGGSPVGRVRSFGTTSFKPYQETQTQWTTDPVTGMFVKKPQPSVLNSGGGDSPSKKGGGRSLPKTKSSKVNLNLKDEMSDALDIAAKYGVIVTSGKDGKHKEGSAHYAGGAFDIRTKGVDPSRVNAVMAALREAGYNVVDERVRPDGSKEWSNEHLHVGGRTGGSRSSRGAFVSAESITASVTAYLRSESDRLTKEDQDQLIDGFISLYVKTGIIPSDAMIDRITARARELAQEEGVLQPGKAQLENELAAIKLNALGIRTPSVSAGDTSISSEIFLQNTEAVPESFMDKRAREANEKFWDDWREQQENAFEDARQSWDNLLTDLANGDFKSVWRNLKDAMLQQFIRPASQYLAQMFGNPLGGGGGQGGAPAMAGGGPLSMLGGIFGSGSMGPGGTPMFNGNNFSGGGQMGGGILGGVGNWFSGLFGGRGGNGGGLSANVFSSPGVSGSLNLPGGGIASSGKGLMGKLGGVGGIASIGGMAASMIGGALGGKWGNFLSMAGMGTSIGASIGGPWGALIGGAIGAGAGLISMLFGRDNAEKKLKEAALSTYGITVKDKSVLKSLKALGETMFGKGQVGKNAAQVVSSDEGQLILRNYAEATNQSSSKIDALYIGDENWKGNQFRSQFGGFRAMGGPVTAGKTYVVGERGPELFTAKQSGSITSNADMTGMMQVLGTLEETVHMLAARLQSLSPGHVLSMGAKENPKAVRGAMESEYQTDLRASETSLRLQGVY